MTPTIVAGVDVVAVHVNAVVDVDIAVEAVVEAVRTRVPVAASPPPAPTPTVNIKVMEVDAADSNPPRRACVSRSKGPVAGVRVVRHRKAPRGRTGTINCTVPRTVVMAGTIDYRSLVSITADVPRSVADVNDGRRRVIHIHVFHIVDRAAWWNRINHLRHGHADHPCT